MSEETVPREWLTKRTSIDEIERFAIEQIHKLRRELPGIDIPELPFGLEHKKWSDFKEQLWPTDEIWEFSSPKELWEAGAGSVGYVAIRSGFVVATMMSGKLPS